MKVSSELVKELQEKIDVTYEEASYLLRKSNGDINKSIIRYYKKQNSRSKRLKKDFSSLFNDALEYKFLISRHGEIKIDIPLIIVIILFVFTYYPLWWVIILVAGLTIVSGSEVKVYRKKPQEKQTVKRKSDNSNKRTNNVSDDGFTEIKIDGRDNK